MRSESKSLYPSLLSSVHTPRILQHHKSYLITSNILVNVCLFFKLLHVIKCSFFPLFLIRNFEESEDELREAVADSMRNLFVMEDTSSDEKEQEHEPLADRMEEEMDEGAVSSGDPQQIQAEVQNSSEEAGSFKVFPAEPESHRQHTTASNEQPQTP